MPRGSTPRQPARTGRHEGVVRRPQPGKSAAKSAGASPRGRAKEPAPTHASLPALAPVPPRAGKYDPIAPARIAEILKRLDQLYPNVKCALTHSSAWGLLVA